MLDFWNHCQLFMAQDEDFEYLFIYQWSTEWTLHTIFPVGLRFQHSNLRYHFDECDYGSLESATLTITKVRQVDFFKKKKKKNMINCVFCSNAIFHKDSVFIA